MKRLVAFAVRWRRAAARTALVFATTGPILTFSGVLLLVDQVLMVAVFLFFLGAAMLGAVVVMIASWFGPESRPWPYGRRGGAIHDFAQRASDVSAVVFLAMWCALGVAALTFALTLLAGLAFD